MSGSLGSMYNVSNNIECNTQLVSLFTSTYSNEQNCIPFNQKNFSKVIALFTFMYIGKLLEPEKYAEFTLFMIAVDLLAVFVGFIVFIVTRFLQQKTRGDVVSA